jgi:hypothetical protein
MSEATLSSDKGLGVALALSAVAFVGAAVMFGYPAQLGKAWGFGTAFVCALLAVVAVQIFE